MNKTTLLLLILLCLFKAGSTTALAREAARNVKKTNAYKDYAQSPRQLTGVDLLNNRRYQEAADYYEQLLRINGPSADNFNYLALAMAGQRLYDQAFKDFGVALSIDPNKAIIYVNRGDLYFSLTHFDKAIEDYSRAIAIDPKCIRAYDARGKTYNIIGQYEKAIADYTKLQILDMLHAGVYLDNRAYAYRKLGNYQNAIKDLSEAISREPKVSLLYLDRAAILAEIEHYKEALSDCNKAIEISPNSKTAFLSRAHCYLHMGELQRALADCNHIKRLNPDRNEASLAFSISAAIMNKQGEAGKALAFANQAIILNPNLNDAYLQRAIANRRLHQYLQVVHDCERVIGVNPKLQEAYDCRAEAFECLAQQDRKIACQLKAAL